ncbi:MAG: hypothetical protein ABIR60_02665, partial [Allosphingosinicella sp.]
KWELKAAIWLEGQSNSQRYAYATWFDFDTGGFVANRHDSLKGALESPATTGADGFRLENIYCTSRAAAGTGHHGLHAACRGDLVRCTFALFPGDGVRFETPSLWGTTANANNSRVLYCQFSGNGGSGLHLIGGDANCFTTLACEFSANGQFGLFDNAFLSNSHTGHHADGNGLGLINAGHKMGAVGSCCSYPIAAWAAGATLAPSSLGVYRVNAGKLYLLVKPGPGTTANAPTHSVANEGSAGADGYYWAWAAHGLTHMQYHVAISQETLASTTVPGTSPAVWVHYGFAPNVQAGVPVWVSGMTWGMGGSYCGNSGVAQSVWAACYSEGSQPPAQIRSPQVWIGGQSPPSSWSTCAQVQGNGGALLNPGGFYAEKPYYNGRGLAVHFSHDLTNGRFMNLYHPTRFPYSFYAGIDLDITYSLDLVGNYIAFTGQATAFTGGRSVTVPGATVVPSLFLGSMADARAHTTGTAAPTTGAHARGEIVYNRDPTSGGFVGWICTTGGTPGAWKTFGAISE